jgi:hypothetical protein
LYEDLQDGHKLLGLLEVLTNQKYVSQQVIFFVILLSRDEEMFLIFLFSSERQKREGNFSRSKT